MIVDADCHISPTSESGNSIEADELLRRMDRAGVDKALVWLQPPYVRDRITKSNAYVHESVKAHPDRLLGFGWADPRVGLEHALEEAKRCVEEFELHGVKLNGAQNEFPIDGEELAMPVIDYIARTGKALAFHIGADSYENTHPTRAAHVAAKYPELRILMVHMGGAAFADLSRATTDAALEHSNMTLVGSAIRPQSILRAVKTLGAGRVCYGSDTPFELMHVEIAKYNALLDGEVSADEKAQIMGKNILRFLRVD